MWMRVKNKERELIHDEDWWADGALVRTGGAAPRFRAEPQENRRSSIRDPAATPASTVILMRRARCGNCGFYSTLDRVYDVMKSGLLMV
jgi:hypothetical protein